jgi:hypothetical protein
MARLKTPPSSQVGWLVDTLKAGFSSSFLIEAVIASLQAISGAPAFTAFRYRVGGERLPGGGRCDQRIH